MSREGSMPSMFLQSIILSNRPLPQPTESTRFPEISPIAFSNRRNSLWNTARRFRFPIILCRRTRENRPGLCLFDES